MELAYNLTGCFVLRKATLPEVVNVPAAKPVFEQQVPNAMPVDTGRSERDATTNATPVDNEPSERSQTTNRRGQQWRWPWSSNSSTHLTS